MIETRRAKQPGFTLVELLVVIAIIGVLVALLLPAVQAAREAARRTQCANNLHNMGIALLNYADAKAGRLPAATQFNPGKVATSFPPPPTNGPGGTWVVQILPYIEQQALYNQFDHKQPPNHPNNARVISIPLPSMICPSSADESTPETSPLGAGLFDTDDKQDGGSNVNPNRATSSGLATQVMGLWYPVSAGPTHFDGCPFCSSPSTQPDYCCQGQSFGSRPTAAANDPIGPPNTPAPTFAGLFGRYEKGIELAEITDGMTNVVMAGETIAVHCKYQCAHCPNFPISMTNTPINTFIRTSKTLGAGTCVVTLKSDPEVGGYCEACGYKSRHPGGAHLAMADGSAHFVSESIDFEVYYLLGARSSGQVKDFP